MFQHGLHEPGANASALAGIYHTTFALSSRTHHVV